MKANELKVNVSRQQYGVGQGCFHVQELVFEDVTKTSPMLTYRFIYDCGASIFQKEKTLDWCIHHATAGSTPLDIDAVYLSHFEADHVNGLKKLCQSATVRRIYAPHITVDQVLHIIAQQLADGVRWTTEYRDFVSTVLAVARGEDIYGVPVTLITSVGSPPEQNSEGSTGEIDTTTIEVVSSQERSVPHSMPIRFLLSGSVGTSQSKFDKWELVHWCYAAESTLTAAILEKIKNVTGYSTKGMPGLRAKAKAAHVAQTLVWFQKNHKEIARAYRAAMKSFNSERKKKSPPKPEIPDNHNVASLCLYSGPTGNTQVEHYSHSSSYAVDLYPFPLWERRRWKNMSWIATGDAMLGQLDIWDSFKKHFGKDRIKGCATVLIPHHGADAKTSQNFTPELIGCGQNCVISAGAKNPYHHPHRNVVSAILDACSSVHLVTETHPQGFLERLKVSFH